MSNSKKDQCISVQVPPELKAKARALSKQTNRSLSRYVRLVLRSCLYRSVIKARSRKVPGAGFL